MILPLECPKCHKSLDGSKVLPESKVFQASTYSKWSTVQIVVENDKAIGFQCPHCSGTWDIPWMSKPPREADDLS
jgi:hypothetical protein